MRNLLITMLFLLLVSCGEYKRTFIIVEDGSYIQIGDPSAMNYFTCEFGVVYNKKKNVVINQDGTPKKCKGYIRLTTAQEKNMGMHHWGRGPK